MTRFLEIKNRMVRFVGEYEAYLAMAAKFVVALTLFIIINTQIGFMHKISNLPVALVLALVCCLLPVNATIIFAALLVLVNMYALSIEALLVTFVLFVVIYFMYFRFAPKHGYTAVLTPIAFKLNVPYFVPVAGGLTKPIPSAVAMVCGTVLFYFLDGVHKNAAALNDTASDAGKSKLNILVAQLTGNKEMIFVIAVLIVTFLLVTLIRRLDIENAWNIAIAAGILFQFVALLTGYLVMGLTSKIVWLVIGILLSGILSYGFKLSMMDLDYSRTERTQFEDDDYYYYVKAIPKKMVPSKEKTVKRFSNTASMGKKIERTPAPKTEDAE